MKNKVLKIIKILLLLTFFGFSFYVATLPTYVNFYPNAFVRYFEAPFAYFVLETSKICGNYLAVGYLVSCLIYFIVYGSIATNMLKTMTSLKDFVIGYLGIFKHKTTDEKYDAMIDFLFDQKTINMMKTLFAFLLLPLAIFAFKGITIDPFTEGELLYEGANLSFLWTSFNSKDAYFIVPIILLLLNVIVPLVFYIKNRKKNSLTIKEKAFFYFQISISMMVVGTSFVNNNFAIYLIILSFISFIWKFIKKYILRITPTAENNNENIENEESELIEETANILKQEENDEINKKEIEETNNLNNVK